MRRNNGLRGPLMAILGLLAAAAATGAECGGDDVLPPDATVAGYSLKDATEAVAAFNVGPRTPDTLPNVPFQILYVPNVAPYPTEATFTVKSGTPFYVPLLYVDDSPPVLGDFPQNVNDWWADAFYMFSLDEIGGSAEINVDGREATIGPEYLVGVKTKPLPDGGGTHVVALGVFLAPLSKGKHRVVLNLAYEGDAWVDAVGAPIELTLTYDIIVK